jgi:hypothetical protein
MIYISPNCLTSLFNVLRFHLNVKHVIFTHTHTHKYYNFFLLKKVLSLEGGTVGDKGAVALAEAISMSKSITTMDIRSCLPTHRNCVVGHLSAEDFDNSSPSSSSSDPDRITSVGLLALKKAVVLRFQDKSSSDVRVIGDIKFSADGS